MARIDSHTRPAVPRFGNRAHRTRKNVYSPFTPAIVLSSPRASVPFPRSKGFSRGLFGTDPKERKNKRKKRKEREPETKRKNKEQETGDKRKRERERDNGANSRCLLFPRPFLSPSSSSFPPAVTRSHPGGPLTTPSLFFRTPRRVANTGCLIRPRRPTINLNK